MRGSGSCHCGLQQSERFHQSKRWQYEVGAEPPCCPSMQTHSSGFQHTTKKSTTIQIDLSEDDRADGEHNPWRIETTTSKHVVDEPSMQTSIAVFKRVHIDESKRDRRRRNNRLQLGLDR